jgi:hypothetical protein
MHELQWILTLVVWYLQFREQVHKIHRYSTVVNVSEDGLKSASQLGVFAL